LYKKFLPLIGVPYENFHTTHESHLNVTNSTQQQEQQQSKLVCAKSAAAGMGALTDHGSGKIHGWDPHDYEIVHNQGRGKLLYDFRNYMLKNVGVPVKNVNTKAPFKIIISHMSSEHRVVMFGPQYDALRNAFPEDEVEIVKLRMKDYSIEEQVRMVSEANIYITADGGGSVSGMFLPAGASMIVYYNDVGGQIYNRQVYTPAMLDWDTHNNFSHLRVHWFPLGKQPGRSESDRDSESSLATLITLVKHELELMLMN